MGSDPVRNRYERLVKVACILACCMEERVKVVKGELGFKGGGTGAHMQGSRPQNAIATPNCVTPAIRRDKQRSDARVYHPTVTPLTPRYCTEYCISRSTPSFYL